MERVLRRTGGLGVRRIAGFSSSSVDTMIVDSLGTIDFAVTFVTSPPPLAPTVVLILDFVNVANRSKLLLSDSILTVCPGLLRTGDVVDAPVKDTFEQNGLIH